MSTDTTTRVCANCGSDELYWADEITGRHPFGTGYEVEVCAECDEPTGERQWVGH